MIIKNSLSESNNTNTEKKYDQAIAVACQWQMMKKIKMKENETDNGKKVNAKKIETDNGRKKTPQ